MRKLLVLCLLVTLLSSIVPAPGVLADEPGRTSEPVELIGMGLDVGEAEARLEDTIVGDKSDEDPVADEIARQELSSTPVPRWPIPNTTVIPYRAVAHLQINWADGSQTQCTGFFVRPRTIMTAGNCVYSYDQSGNPIGGRGWTTRIVVTPALDGTTSPPYGSRPAFYMYSNTNWARSSRPKNPDGTNDNNHNYGFVLLPDQYLFDQIKWLFGVQSYNATRFAGSWIMVTDFQGGTSSPPAMYGGKGLVSNLANPYQWGQFGILAPLQDGAPCWDEHQNSAWTTRAVVGVSVPGGTNCLAIRPQILDTIAQLP